MEHPRLHPISCILSKYKHEGMVGNPSFRHTLDTFVKINNSVLFKAFWIESHGTSYGYFSKQQGSPSVTWLLSFHKLLDGFFLIFCSIRSRKNPPTRLLQMIFSYPLLAQTRTNLSLFCNTLSYPTE